MGRIGHVSILCMIGIKTMSIQPPTTYCRNSLYTFSLPALLQRRHYYPVSKTNTFVTCKCNRFRSILDLKKSQDLDFLSTTTSRAREVLSILVQQNPRKTWQRLSPVVELASLLHTPSTQNEVLYTSIADIGCDHGLLSFALASLGHYQQVIGIDVSHEALHNGAFRVMDKVQAILNYKNHDAVHSSTRNAFIEPCLEFRLGNGLRPLLPGEAQIICIMGMGVETMIQILSQTQGETTDNRILDILGTRRLILQPNPSRPRNLIKLYQALNQSGWYILDEKICYVASRWYITCAFEKKSTELTDTPSFPGSILSQTLDLDMQREYQRYIQHHLSWILQDKLRRKNAINLEEDMWLKFHVELEKDS